MATRFCAQKRPGRSHFGLRAIILQFDKIKRLGFEKNWCHYQFFTYKYEVYLRVFIKQLLSLLSQLSGSVLVKFDCHVYTNQSTESHGSIVLINLSRKRQLFNMFLFAMITQLFFWQIKLYFFPIFYFKNSSSKNGLSVTSLYPQIKTGSLYYMKGHYSAGYSIRKYKWPPHNKILLGLVAFLVWYIED